MLEPQSTEESPNTYIADTFRLVLSGTIARLVMPIETNATKNKANPSIVPLLILGFLLHVEFLCFFCFCFNARTQVPLHRFIAGNGCRMKYVHNEGKARAILNRLGLSNIVVNIQSLDHFTILILP